MINRKAQRSSPPNCICFLRMGDDREALKGVGCDVFRGGPAKCIAVRRKAVWLKDEEMNAMGDLRAVVDVLIQRS